MLSAIDYRQSLRRGRPVVHVDGYHGAQRIDADTGSKCHARLRAYLAQPHPARRLAGDAFAVAAPMAAE
jgi:hypothetical protein